MPLKWLSKHISLHYSISLEKETSAVKHQEYENKNDCFSVFSVIMEFSWKVEKIATIKVWFSWFWICLILFLILHICFHINHPSCIMSQRRTDEKQMQRNRAKTEVGLIPSVRQNRLLPLSLFSLSHFSWNSLTLQRLLIKFYGKQNWVRNKRRVVRSHWQG